MDISELGTVASIRWHYTSLSKRLRPWGIASSQGHKSCYILLNVPGNITSLNQLPSPWP